MGTMLKELWHKFILLRLKAFNAYCDEQSEERLTGVKKRKYKLALNVIRDIQIYPFFVLNSSLNCSRYYAFEVQCSDWVYKAKTLTGYPYLSKAVSYIDVKKMEMIPQDELYNKMKSRSQFFWVGKLTTTKCDKLKEFCNRVKNTTDVQPEYKGLMLRELTGDDGGFSVDSIIDRYRI